MICSVKNVYRKIFIKYQEKNGGFYGFKKYKNGK
jgi:hypothetical protein